MQTQREKLENDYWKFWDKQTYKYGMGEHEKYIVQKILSLEPKSVFEVGIGNGYPFAKTFVESGLRVDGCDVSSDILRSARKNLGEDKDVNLYTGDIREIDVGEEYDVVYCIRVSWYFKTKDFLETIQKMIKITRPGGYIVFDVMKLEPASYFKSVFGHVRTVVRQCVKKIIKGQFSIGPINYLHSTKKIEKLLRDTDVHFDSYDEAVISGIIQVPKKIMYLCQKG